MNKITVLQALERGILTRHTDYRGRFFNADLCGGVRFSSGKLALAAYAEKCRLLNRAL